MKPFWLSCLKSSSVLLVSGLLINVGRLEKVLACFSLEMIFFVSWLVIPFVLLFLSLLLQVSMLYCLNYIPVLWLATLAARNYLS
jgi:hypothetical protein